MPVDCTPNPQNRQERLSAEAAALPLTPGVYLFKDLRGQVLYVGKARSLRNRVRSYFLPSTDLGPRKGAMLDLIESIDPVDVATEAEALFLESRLIKDLKPE